MAVDKQSKTVCKETPEEYTPPAKIIARLPPALQPYGELIRIHKPLGYNLITCPYFVGVAFSAAVSPIAIPTSLVLNRLLILTLWSLCLRSGGCVWDDLVDQDLDAQISRTRLRPLPRGAVSTTNALTFAAGLFLSGLSLTTLLPRECTFDAVGMLFFALLYPFGKRFTNFPQLILCSTGWAVPMAMHSFGLDLLANAGSSMSMVLYFASLIVLVDVVYACQDLEEDIKVGVKSMAVRFKNSISAIVDGLVYASTLFLVGAGLFSGLGLAFYIVSVTGHFWAFRTFATLSKRDASSGGESLAKLACCVGTLGLIVGLVLECRLGG